MSESKITEIKKLYDISEAEEVCLLQMSAMIKLLGFSPKLTTKLLKALGAIYEVLVDEMEAEIRKKNK